MRHDAFVQRNSLRNINSSALPLRNINSSALPLRNICNTTLACPSDASSSNARLGQVDDTDDDDDTGDDGVVPGL